MSENPRADEFRAEIDALRLKTSGDRDRLFQWLGAILMVGGVILSFAAFIVANGQDSGDLAIDSLEHNEHTILAIGGLALAVTGSAVFLRYSIGRFLRFWLLRQIFETRSEDL